VAHLCPNQADGSAKEKTQESKNKKTCETHCDAVEQRDPGPGRNAKAPPNHRASSEAAEDDENYGIAPSTVIAGNSSDATEPGSCGGKVEPLWRGE
jgi:hypothetical protein